MKAIKHEIHRTDPPPLPAIHLAAFEQTVHNPEIIVTDKWTAVYTFYPLKYENILVTTYSG